MNKKYFTRIPNEFIQCDIQKKFGTNRKFYITYVLIDKYRSLEDCSWITLKKVLEVCGYKTTKNKPKAFYEIISVLEYMVENQMIQIVQDLNTLSYGTGVEIKIISDNFDYPEKWTKLNSNEFELIMSSESQINKENLLLTYLYVRSYMDCRPKNPDGSEQLSNPEKRPEAFYGSLYIMSEKISMSRDTITKCLQHLVEIDLLKKEVVGCIKKENDKVLQNVSNIYVINKKGYSQEIEWTLQKIKEMYNVNEVAAF